MSGAQPGVASHNGGTTAILRTEVFDRLTSAKGVTQEGHRARLIGVNRNSLLRMRKRQFAPRLSVAMRMAALLGTTVDELFELVTDEQQQTRAS
jgi:DNA-binding XRE family transcriptional regulator